MQVSKVIKLMASSRRSWEDAVQKAIRKSFGSLRSVQGIDVIKRSVHVDIDNIMRYGVTLHVTFLVEQQGQLVGAGLAAS